MEQEILNETVNEVTNEVISEATAKAALNKTDLVVGTVFAVGCIAIGKAIYSGGKKLIGKVKDYRASKQNDEIIDGEFTEVEEETEE